MNELIKKYMAIPSPTSYTDDITDHIEATMKGLNLTCKRTKKGALIVTKEGMGDAVALTAHVDTLGGIVKAINDDGSLNYHRLGGGSWNAVEGENCHVITRDQKHIRGSILPIVASSHIYGVKSYDTPRNEDNMLIRLDEIVSSKEDVEKLGISVGDIIYMDTRTEFSNGFLKSRYIDNKAAVAILVKLAGDLHKCDRTVHLIFSNYEEVGHGLSYIPEDTEVLIALDIAPVGKNQNSDEYSVSIAAKDNKTPYDYKLISELRKVALDNEIPFNIDVFNFYSSDASQYVHRGGDVKFACVGPGVTGTHHYERTHESAIQATYDLLDKYINRK